VTSRFNEVYEIVRTVEIVSNHHTYRIDVQRDYSNPTSAYQVAWWTEEEIVAQPAFPQTSGRFDREPEVMSIWTRASMPWVSQSTAEAALASALSFIAESSS